MKRKRIISLFLIIVLLFFGIVKVNAKVCEYKYNKETITLTTEKDENGFIEVTTDIPGEYDGKFKYIDDSIFINENQCLETITVCTIQKSTIPDAVFSATMGGATGIASSVPPWGFMAFLIPASIEIINELTGENYIAVFGSSLDPVITNDAIAYEFDDISDKGFWEYAIWTGYDELCTTVEYSGEDRQAMKDSGNFISFCAKFLSMYTDMASAYQKYGACQIDSSLSIQEKSRCKADAFTEINKQVEKLKDTCNNILQNSNISVKDGCAASCLNVNDTLKALKDKYGMEITDVNECSISSRLVIWIANIIRWVKYIIPVLVIILSILDFIKVTGSGKDDDMKKAQGKFIKRLIAAALIFIAPFIIQFVIEKMGFEANGCGIIDL